MVCSICKYTVCTITLSLHFLKYLWNLPIRQTADVHLIDERLWRAVTQWIRAEFDRLRETGSKTSSGPKHTISGNSCYGTSDVEHSVYCCNSRRPEKGGGTVDVVCFRKLQSFASGYDYGNSSSLSQILIQSLTLSLNRWKNGRGTKRVQLFFK